MHLVRPGAERDRAMLTALGCVGELTAAMVRDARCGRARHLHVGSFYLLPELAPELAGLFAEARGAGRTTSLDTQGDWEGRWQGGLRETLRETDLYFANHDEARAVAAGLGRGAGRRGAAPPGARRAGSARPATEAARPATRRARGLAALGATHREAAAHRAPRARRRCRRARRRAALTPVDTIGAGDSFDAGFVYGHLQGWPVARSLAFAAACGSLSTAAAGGVAAQPSLTAALASAGGDA